MSKRVLAISSSLRKGSNSEALCDQFMKGAIEAGHQVEKVRLAERKINYCKGCFACTKSGKCLQKDDMEPLLNDMLAADVIVLATPVYFYTMCAQMKTMIDRIVARFRDLTNKEFYFILAAADSRPAEMERTIESFRGFTSCLPGAIEKGIIFGLGARLAGDITDNPAMAQALEMGRAS